jgi:uncharacterized membrane protein
MTQKLQNHLANGYDVKISDYITEGYEIFKKNAGGFIGYTVLYFVITIILGFIPLVNLANSIIISPCLVFGFYLVAKKVSEGTIPDFGLFFKGFDYFGKIIVINLIIFAIILACILPILFMIGFNFLSFSNSSDTAEAIRNIFTSTSITLILVFILALIFITSCWIFATQFAVFHNMESWQAMEISRKLVMKNWLMIFLFLIVLGVIAIIGAMFCGIGLIVAIPLIYCSLYASFKDLAGIPGEDNSDEIANIGSSL